MNELAIGKRVRIGKLEGESFDNVYGNPEGLEGVVVDHDPLEAVHQWVVEVEEEPDGTPDAWHYYYPDLYKAEELTVIDG